MKNRWFETVFLVSLIERVLNNNNAKYENTIIISEKQYNICQIYMNNEVRISHIGQGFSRNYFLKIELEYFTCYARAKGRYYFFEAWCKIDKAKKSLEGKKEYLDIAKEDYKEDLAKHPYNEELLTYDLEEIEDTKKEIAQLEEYISNYKVG